MIALVGSVFVAALLGSVHCAAMCGSFACIAAGGRERGRPGRQLSSAYNLGRLLSYTTLGLLAGAAGAGLDRAGTVAGFARPAATIAGLLLIAWGVATLFAILGVHVPALAVPDALASGVARAMRAVRSRPAAQRALLIGILSAALPCGWLYAFVATAAAAGSAAGGAGVMGAFWLGTVPMMATVGLMAQRAAGPLRRRLPAITATVLIVLGALTAAGRFAPPSHAADGPVGRAAHAHD